MSADIDPDALVIESDAPEAEEPAPKAKRKKSTPLNARSLAECRKRGWTAQVVERRLPRTFTTVDLFGVIDIVAIAAVPGRKVILGIQACAGTDHAKRREKILAEPRVQEWIAAHGHMELWSWSKRGAAGKRKLWTLRVETYAEMVAAQEARAA